MAAFFKVVGQVMCFIVFSILINWITDALHLPVPGSIVGIIILFLLLQFKIVKLEWIDVGSKWLLAEMLLFFIPPVVGVIEYKEMLLDSGLRIAAAIVISILIVMIVTGLLAEKLSGREGKQQL
ncbi:MAG: CidA/LrgA family holin-like protein [Paenibacillaceae bacterium]|jgi:holin-like protein|nr:CidA/LrgA family holin-like protein [Paenibacillaceae bacterium]